MKKQGIPFSQLIYGTTNRVGLTTYQNSQAFDWQPQINYAFIKRMSLFLQTVDGVGNNDYSPGYVSFIVAFMAVKTSGCLVTQPFTTWNRLCKAHSDNGLLVPFDVLIKTDPNDTVIVQFAFPAALPAGTLRWYFQVEGDYYYEL